MAKQALRFVGFTLTLLVLAATSYAGDRDEATGTTGVTLYEVSERVCRASEKTAENRRTDLEMLPYAAESEK